MMKGSSSYVAQQQSGSAPIPVATPLPPANKNYARADDVLLLDKHLKIQRTATHNFAIVLNVVTCGAALNIALAQVLSIMLRRHVVSWLETVVRMYELLFSILVVGNELQWTILIKESRILTSYTFRGILYTFIGILGIFMNDIIGQNSSDSYSDESYANNNITIYLLTGEQALELYIRIVSWSMLGFGVIYVVMGVMKIQQKVDRHKEEYQLRLAHARQETDEKGMCMCGVMA
jgi:hypothetical protein